MKRFHFILFFIILTATSIQTGAQTCKPSGGIRGRKPPPGHATKRMTRIAVSKGGDGGGPSECDNQYHSDETPVVALSTGWYKGGDRCHKYITINGNGRSVKAMVVDECDSTMGCDADHDYQPPCPNNIVDASKAVWKALGVSQDNWGDLDITWSE
ncbi:putative RlpA-like domain superfamily, kiwellin [Helianthus debilis subsp. tardiflorus]